MDVYNWDWELVSKFIPIINPIVTAIIAIAVYKIWHKQKEKESLAKVANELILEDMKICLGMTKHHTAEEVKNYMIEIENYFNSIQLFIFLTQNNKSKKILVKRYDYMVSYFNNLYTNPDHFFSVFIKENPYHDGEYLQLLISYITYKK
jgi:hypothetical protein